MPDVQPPGVEKGSYDAKAPLAQLSAGIPTLARELGLAAVPEAQPTTLAGAAESVAPSDPVLADALETIEVPKAPGTGGRMEVVVAAEVLRRVTRTRQVVSLVSQVIIRSYEEEALLAETCRHLVAFGGYLMSWVGLAEEKPERIVRPVAHAGLDSNFLQALKITWSNDLANRSPTSRAIQEQRPYVARNILKEPRYAVLRNEAQLHGYTATCALPLQFAQYGLGVLTVHAAEPDAFAAEEVSLLRELANDVAAGIIGLRERAKRQVLEERLAAVIDAADDAIIGTDLEGLVTDWNAGATRLFGFERNEVVGRPITETIVPPERLEEALQVRAQIASGERVGRFETLRRCKMGRIIHTSIMITPILGGDGAILGATAVEHDITAARAAEGGRRIRQMELAEAARLKSLDAVRKTFISEASHELNTPLTPLRLHVEALAERDDVTEAQRLHLVVIERSVLRLGNLVRDMLEASRLETGRFGLELEDVPVSAVMDEAVQNLDEPLRQAQLSLATGRVAALLVRADRPRVGQVLYNLIANAIGFTPPGGQITLSSRLEDGQAVLRVTDTGVGLSPEQIGQLFQPFSRPNQMSPSDTKGTGLGLFIAKGIVEQHGGRIWAESEGPGRGSSFCFSLPLAADVPKPARGESPLSDSDRGAPGGEEATQNPGKPPSQAPAPGRGIRSVRTAPQAQPEPEKK